jgi:ligand-binding sensor domain-containing protein
MGGSAALRKKMAEGTTLSDAYSDLQNTRESLEDVWTRETNPDHKEKLRIAYASFLQITESVRNLIKQKSHDEAMLSYEKLMINWNEFWEAKEPKREHYESDADYLSARAQWSFNRSMDQPNRPGYERANND